MLSNFWPCSDHCGALDSLYEPYYTIQHSRCVKSLLFLVVVAYKIVGAEMIDYVNDAGTGCGEA